MVSSTRAMDGLVDEAPNVLRAPWTAILEYFLVLSHMEDPTTVRSVYMSRPSLSRPLAH